MKRLFVVLFCVLVLSACGGGGDSSLPSNASLSLQDQMDPSGAYFDQVVITTGDVAGAYIRMDAAFDTYLYLFSDAVLSEPDMNNWPPYLIAFNDDSSAATTNSEILLPNLPAGTYVLLATSFDPGVIGDYSLTSNLFSQDITFTTSSYLQFRTFENPLDDHYRAWIDLKNQGNLILPSDIQSVQFFDPVGGEMVPGIAPLFYTSRYTIAAWNQANSQFEFIAADEQSGMFFDLSDQALLQTGTWRVIVQPAIGGALGVDLNFPQLTELVPIASSSMLATWNPDGSLTLSWVAPPDSPQQYRVYLADAVGNDLFFGRVLPGTSQVTLSASLLQQIKLNGSLTTPANIQWRMQTRNYSGSNNYARSLSDPVTISWP